MLFGLPARSVLTGLLTIAFAIGCEPGPTAQAPAAKTSTAEVHEHPSEGPHHGQLVELGNEEFHAEVVHDDAVDELIVYILDSAAKSAVPIDATELTINVKIADQPKQFALAAAPQADESDGKSSRFRLASKELLEVLHGEAAAKISLQIKGKPYSGTVPHEDHAGHDHKH